MLCLSTFISFRSELTHLSIIYQPVLSVCENTRREAERFGVQGFKQFRSVEIMYITYIVQY